MLFTQDRNQLRMFFCQAWKKYRNKETIQPLEQQIVAIISLHPEYHAMLENEEEALGKEFRPEMGESNPFLHLSMHMAIRDQLSIKHPAGITEIYQSLLAKYNDPHQVEHLMMECLANELWKTHTNKTAPGYSKYMNCLYKAINCKM